MSEENNILQVQGINSKGYGTIAKLAMKDRRLRIYNIPINRGVFFY